MKSSSEFSAQDKALIQREYADLMEAARARCADLGHQEVIRKAFEFANSAHNGVRRRSGEPYILHPINVAKIVVREIGLGHKSICAALLHDVVEDTSYTVEDIQNVFGEKIASLVDGLTKIKTVLDNEEMKLEDTSLQAENFKRILLTLNEDARVVLIKLADRLHNCRTIEFVPEYKREKILSETMYIFIPLAHRLGLYGIKSEMENIWLRFKEPAAYNEITNLINADSVNKDLLLQEFLVPIRDALDRSGIEYSIKTRVKTPYSIWHKINFKHVTFEQISDLYAVRIIFVPKSTDIIGERNECFQIFALITGIYDYRPERVRDWVMHPKPNGYEALHVTALTKDHKASVEVQIRSIRMDEIAEKGISAHWNYKKLQPQAEESQLDKWIASIKNVLQNPDVNSLEMLDMIHNDLIDSQIVIFDNKGSQYSMPKGSTALDFAYSLGVGTGSHAIAVKINYKLSPLSYILRTGDQVEVICSKSESAKIGWLSFLTTPLARNAVKTELGLGEGHAEEVTPLGGGTVIASCCNPIPGDPVVGFLRNDSVVEIHKKSCPVADSIASKFGDRIVNPKWILDTYASFPVRLMLQGIDRVGLMHEITGKLSREMKISFKRINVQANDGLFEGYIDFWVHDIDTLSSIIRLLEGIPGIQHVTRTDIK